MYTFFWIGVLSGVMGGILFLALFVPDDWARWLVERKNLPKWLMPFGIVAFLVAMGNLIYAVGGALIKALSLVRVAPWVWGLLFVGVVLVALFILTRKFFSEPKTDPEVE